MYEGWEVARQRFYSERESGASLECPTLRRLMKTCVAGQVDRTVDCLGMVLRLIETTPASARL